MMKNINEIHNRHSWSRRKSNFEFTFFIAFIKFRGGERQEGWEEAHVSCRCAVYLPHRSDYFYRDANQVKRTAVPAGKSWSKVLQLESQLKVFLYFSGLHLHTERWKAFKSFPLYYRTQKNVGKKLFSTLEMVFENKFHSETWKSFCLSVVCLCNFFMRFSYRVGRKTGCYFWHRVSAIHKISRSSWAAS